LSEDIVKEKKIWKYINEVEEEFEDRGD